MRIVREVINFEEVRFEVVLLVRVIGSEMEISVIEVVYVSS